VHKALDAGDHAAASTLVDRLAALIPNYGELPALRAALVQVDKQDNGDLADALRQAQDALRAGRITGEGNDTALAYYKAALAIDPDNADAKAGLGQVAQALIVQANAALDSGDQAQAHKLVDQAAELAPHSADLAAVRARLGDGHKASSALPVASDAGEDTGPMQHPVLTPQQNAALARMIQRADAAAQQGKLMLPPGDSAYDLYRDALAIDGNNELARHGLEALPNLAMSQFNQALANGNLSVAADRLADLGDLSPGAAGQAELRQRLASAWLDQAEQQLQHGDRAGAGESLDSARKLAPGNPRLATLAARLQAGT
jgi:tetratricopeptide (TPR) repeat protein